jgi:predicted dehydrogenase
MPQLDRRQFLGSTAAAGAALAIGSAAARAAESPNEQIVIGVMGVNGRGAGLVRGFAGLPGIEVAYVCDVDDQAAEKCVGLLGQQTSRTPQSVRDFRKILDDPSVDALLIAAPDHWHGPATILACSAGKHVYVEKPACHNPREGELMIAAARKHNRVVQMGNQRRSSAGVKSAIDRMHAGEIGRVLFSRGWITSARPNIGYGKAAAVPAHLDYTLWQGPAPDREYRDNLVHYNWHWFWHYGTGELGNNGIHALDLCRWGLGVDYPISATCAGGKFHFDDDQETPDTQLATFDFGGKAIHWEHRTWHKRGIDGMDWGATFYGENGTLIIGNNKYTIHDPGDKVREEVPLNNGETEHQQNFLDCIRGGGTPNSEIEEGVKSTLLCHLGNIALRSGQTVRLDPQTHQIVGNEQQQALWTREYRPGWEPVV